MILCIHQHNFQRRSHELPLGLLVFLEDLAGFICPTASIYHLLTAFVEDSFTPSTGITPQINFGYGAFQINLKGSDGPIRRKR